MGGGVSMGRDTIPATGRYVMGVSEETTDGEAVYASSQFWSRPQGILLLGVSSALGPARGLSPGLLFNRRVWPYNTDGNEQKFYYFPYGTAMEPYRPSLGISILASKDADERISMETFAVVVAAWSEIVRRVTLEQSGPRPLVRWVVKRLDTGSAHVDYAPVLTPHLDGDLSYAELVKDAVPRIVGEGMARIEGGDDPTIVFSPEVAEQARILVRPLLSEHISRILVRAAEREVTLTREGAGQHHEATSKLRSIGSVEGELKAVSFSESRPFFSVYRPTGGRAVKCYFDERRFLDDVLANLRRRVLVSGRISRADDGTPLTVADVRLIRTLGGSDLPQPSDLVGIAPDLTGDLLSEDWLQRRRRG